MAKKINFNKNKRNLEEKVREALSKKNISTPKLPPIIKRTRPVNSCTYPKPSLVRIDRASNNKIFITGGIGDILTLESYFTDKLRDSLETIYYATSKHVPISNIFKSLPNYPKLKNHIVVWNDFTKFWAFCSKEEYITKCRQFRLEIENGVLSSEDYSISAKFPYSMPYNQSSVLTHSLADISKFILPDEFFVICPFSSDKRLKSRDFDQEDWSNVFKILKNANIPGVVINSGKDIIAKNTHLIDLNNKTNILESIEILKKSRGYIGVDSCLSVLAAKLFTHPNILVKSVNEHLYRWKHLYYAPSTDFQFLSRNVRS